MPLILWGGLAGKPGTDHTPVSLTQIHSTLLSAGGVASNVQTDLREAPSGGPVFSETNQDGVSLRAVWVEDRKTIWNRATNEMVGFDLSVIPANNVPRLRTYCFKSPWKCMRPIRLYPVWSNPLANVQIKWIPCVSWAIWSDVSDSSRLRSD